MKKLLAVFALVALFGATFVRPTYATEEVQTPECVVVNAPNPITFSEDVSSIGTVMASYQWFEGPEGTWTLKIDTNPLGGVHNWESSYPSKWGKGIFFWLQKPVVLPQTIVENSCEPEVPTCEDGYHYDGEAEQCVVDETPQEPETPVEQPFSAPGPAGAPTCDTGGNVPGTIQTSTATRVGTNAVVAYWPTVLGGQVNIRYREVGSNEWHHALRDYPNLGVAPIGLLKDGVKYEYQIANGHGCNQSNWSKVFVGF